MLSQFVTLLIAPLGTALLLAWLGWWLSGRRNPHTARRGRRLVLLAGVWLAVWSLPVVSEGLRGALEARAGERLLQRLPNAPALVVLGGGVAGPRPPLRPDPDLGRSADRLWHAARLYHAGKAPVVVVSGGVVRTGDGSEAQAMHQVLRSLGVADAAIWMEDQSANTAGNAARVVQLLRTRGVEQPLLVTSALHMPRAVAEFAQAGMAVTPAPTDFEVTGGPRDALDWLPGTDALDGSGRAFKELLGLLRLQLAR